MGKNKLHDESLVFKKNCEVFALKGDLLEMIPDYKINTRDLPLAKTNSSFLHEMNFDLRTKGQRTRDEIVKKLLYNIKKELYLHQV